MKPYSLTRRLIVAVLLVELASAGALIVVSSAYEGLSRFHALDIRLRGRADSILGAVQDAEDQDDNVMLDGTEKALPREDIYQVRDDRGRDIGHSATGQRALASATGAAVFRKLEVDGREYRVVRLDGSRVVDPGEAGGHARRVIILYGMRTAPVWHEVEESVQIYAFIGLVLLLVTSAVMLWTLRRGLRPLHELAAQASRVTVQAWEFEPSAEARAVRELAPLSDALRTALAGLQRSFAQQNQFVGDAAHELKTSVAVVKSSIQVLAMRPRGVADYQAGLRRLQADCERMEELVASMLMLARLEGASPAEENSAIDLRALAAEVIEQLSPVAVLGGVEVRNEDLAGVTQPGPAWVWGEREQLRLLCSNLLHNALQHSPAGSVVRVSRTSADGGFELRIADSGPGIPAGVLPHVFDRFYRGDPSRSRRTGGTGLGLAIARAIALRFHGGIDLESEVGRGTTAVIRLPRCAAPVIAQPAEPALRIS